MSDPRTFDREQARRIEQQIALQYRFAAGAYATRFFTALRDEGRILATRDREGNVMMPPRPICGLSGLPMDEWVEVGPDGVLAGCTIVYVPFIDPMTGSQRPVPYGFGLVRLTGADTSIYHLLDETDPERIGVGKRVEAIFKPQPERTGSLADIRHFRLLD
ncbi:MAG: Zn-ribbon domain-containing OB-fold protein [Solirubrobacteraceae bacterium]